MDRETRLRAVIARMLGIQIEAVGVVCWINGNPTLDVPSEYRHRVSSIGLQVAQRNRVQA